MEPLEKLVRSLIATGIEDRIIYQTKVDYSNGELNRDDVEAADIIGEMRRYINKQEIKPLKKWDQQKLL